MLSKLKEIEEEALRLAPNERALLAERLISSLDDEEDPEAERLWIEEAERRYIAYKEGRVKAKPAELVFKEARSKLK
ncbi:MAG: addiction module protein [Bacillota bacterium]|jgi:putative addiction module component (TIGR02574 family)|nr:MAG: addiction module antitoxin RelB [Ammonifex sp.]